MTETIIPHKAWGLVGDTYNGGIPCGGKAKAFTRDRTGNRSYRT